MQTLTGLSPTREQQYQERLVLSLSRKIEPALTREIARAMNELGKNPDAYSSILASHKARLADTLGKQYKTTMTTFGTRILKSAAKAEALKGTAEFTEAASNWIRNVGAQKVTEISGTTMDQAQNIISRATAAAIEDGLSEINMAKLIRSEVSTGGGQLSRYRSRMIARTETHAASSAAGDLAAVATGIPNIMKEWVASGGERTREDHRIANGQIVPLDQPFKVGGSLLMYPSDPSGSAAQVINCRCVSVQVVS